MADTVQIVYCMMQQDRLESVRANLGRVLPFVDRAVVVDNGSTDGTRDWLETLRPKVAPVHRQWNDNFVEGRNAYVAEAGRIAAEDASRPTLLCAADDDELYSDGLLRDLREVAEQAYLEDLNILGIESRDVETDWTGGTVSAKFSGWHKPLFIFHEPGMRYVARGHSNVHEDPVLPSGVRWNVLPGPTNRAGSPYWYDHVKPHGEIWLRGIRNAFAGGGGMNLGDLVPLWKPLREIAAGLGIETSNDLVRYLRAGDIHPDLALFFWENRLIGTPLDPRRDLWPGWPDGCSEYREGWLAYFVYLHPEQMPPGLPEADREYMDYAAEVRIIWGPKAPEWAK